MSTNASYSPHWSSTEQFAEKNHIKQLGDDTLSPLFNLLKSREREDLGTLDFSHIVPTILEGGFGSDVHEDNRRIDAGWTYFGQFIAHDLTLRRELGEKKPRLNLDCLYGFGPRANAHLYEVDANGDSSFQGICFALDSYPYQGSKVPDVFRIGNDVPVMADVRNDDNFIINQLHCAFLQFHNKMAEFFKENKEPAETLFSRTRQFVTWTYQWIIVNEYLNLLTGEVADTLIKKKDYKILSKKDRDKGPALLPEFIAAALRMGHSQAREVYTINAYQENIPVFGNENMLSLMGFKRDENRGPLDWRFFFNFDDQPMLQKSRPIDLFLASPMRNIPFPRHNTLNIGQINIKRSEQYKMIIQPKDLLTLNELGIKTIPDFATALHSLYPADSVWEDWNIYKEKLLKLPGWPLWIFLLLEARVAGKCSLELEDIDQQLGPLGAQIVAEQLVWILQKDSLSYLRQCSNWHPMQELLGKYTPLPPPTSGTFQKIPTRRFSITDVLHIAENGIPSSSLKA